MLSSSDVGRCFESVLGHSVVKGLTRLELELQHSVSTCACSLHDKDDILVFVK